MNKTKLLVIVGTTRTGRVGRKLADWYISQATKVAPKDAELELLDIADFNLPLFNEAVPPLYHQYNDVQNEIAAKIGAADGFVFVTGEYNHTIPSSLKNFLEYINAEWHHKAAAFVGYGSTGAVRSIEHLIQILAELRVASIATSGDHIHVNAPWEGLHEDGTPKDGYVHGDIAKQLDELVWWANALKVARG